MGLDLHEQAESLSDAVCEVLDTAPSNGWSPSAAMELAAGASASAWTGLVHEGPRWSPGFCGAVGNPYHSIRAGVTISRSPTTPRSGSDPVSP